jgi:hypothetical protein
MPTASFPGEAGRKLWENVRSHLHLIADAPRLRMLSGDELRTAELQMITFMVTAAWGYTWISDRAYGSRFNRFAYLRKLNKLIYQVSYAPDDLVVDITGGGGVNRFSLGPAQGFSAVVPLTREGYDDYMENRLSASELGERHILPYEQSINNSDFLLITGTVHFPSLAQERRLDDAETIRQSAFPVIADLLRHLGRLAPPLAIAGDTGASVYVDGDVFRPPPTILCFISGRGSGEPLLRKAGFVHEGEDKTGNRKYVLRVGGTDWSGRKVNLLKKIIHYQRND